MIKQFYITVSILFFSLFFFILAGTISASEFVDDPDSLNGVDSELIDPPFELESQEHYSVTEPNGETPDIKPIQGAAMNDVIPIQGRLTDSNGKPLNGSFSITARIYDQLSGGTSLCSDNDPVTVTNGLFNMNMDFCNSTDIDGEQLYLGIQVGADAEMSPRQAIHATPYAWTVRPGAVIKGAASYLFVPATAFILNSSDEDTTYQVSSSLVRFSTSLAVGYIRSIRIPITIPAVLYGQNVRVSEIRVYYKCENGANNFIAHTQLTKMTDADSSISLINDSTDRTSDTATFYTLNTDPRYNTLSSSQGFLTLRLGLYIQNTSANEEILISGVRLTLLTNY